MIDILSSKEKLSQLTKSFNKGCSYSEFCSLILSTNLKSLPQKYRDHIRLFSLFSLHYHFDSPQQDLLAIIECCEKYDIKLQHNRFAQEYFIRCCEFFDLNSEIIKRIFGIAEQPRELYIELFEPSKRILQFIDSSAILELKGKYD